MALPNWTLQQCLDQLIGDKQHWQGTITYSFPTSSAQIYAEPAVLAGFKSLTADQKYHAQQAIGVWASFLHNDVVEVAPGNSSIEFGNSTTMGSSYAFSYFPPNGSTWFNWNYNASTGSNSLNPPVEGQHGYETYLHEIGHALGLNHMGNYNGAGAQPSSYQDSDVFSIMSYFGPGNGSGEGLVQWADWVGADGKHYSPQTPMPLDIAAIQTIYGVEPKFHTEDTIFGFNSNVTGRYKELYDFSVNKNPILTIYDSGGNDTLDFSGYSTPSDIDLNKGGYSSANSMTFNIAVAYSADIENAIGGPAGDTIWGNTLNNFLKGGGGNDYIDGDGGIDTAVFFDKRAEHAITDVGNKILVSDTKAGSDGNDTLINIERLNFSDGNLLFYIAETADNAEVYRLYKAGFARTPDEGGLNYWIGQHGNGLGFESMAGAFRQSAEFIQKYGSNLSNPQYVNVLYQNVLGRPGEASGVAFWTNQLNNNIINQDQALLAFSDSQENINATKPNYDNGYWVL